MNTLAQMGVAAGYAAAIMKRERCSPRELYARGLVREIQRKMGGEWPGNPDPNDEGWQVVDDESPGVTFGTGWRRKWNENGEQVGHASHVADCKRATEPGAAAYPLPVKTEGDYLVRMKTPFLPWPLEQTVGRTAIEIHTGGEVVRLSVNQGIRQGRWRVIGRFRLRPGAILYVVPGKSSSSRCVADGFAIKALAEPSIVDRVANAGQYADLSPHFAQAFDFLQRADLAALKEGRHEIDGSNCWAMVQTAALTPMEDEPTVEAHCRYADIQAPITGDETIGTCPFDANRTDLAFDTTKDVVLYKTAVVARTLRPGEFALFFPCKDAHAPCHASGTPTSIRKLIIKVRCE